MAQQNNPGMREEEEVEKRVQDLMVCVCCGQTAVSVIVSDERLCLQCHHIVPTHIRKAQKVRFAKAYKRRKDESRLRQV
jgi:hypothetical protein